LPAIIKDIEDSVYHIHVFYNGFWQEDMVNENLLEARTEDISPYLYKIRKQKFEECKK
jgi:hypothetical protein